MAVKYGPADGHGLTLSETNSGGYVALCRCGWEGHVHRPDIWTPYKGAKPRPRPGLAIQAALNEYGAHADEARKVARVAATDRAVALLRRPGRFSHA